MDKKVALLTEGVDRNIVVHQGKPSSLVALLTEGVDRNQKVDAVPEAESAVALLTEGVDRNDGSWIEGYCAARRPPHGGRFYV